MKTILIAHKYSDNSFAAMSKALAIKLAKDGYKVIFISHKTYHEPYTDEHGVKVYCWPENRPTGLKSLKLSLKLHFKYRPDVSIAHFSAVNWVMLSAFLSGAKKRMAYYHTISEAIKIDNKSVLLNTLKTQRLRLVYKVFTTNIIPVSEYSKADFKKCFFPNPNIGPTSTVCHNGLPDRFNGVSLKPKSSSMPITINYLGRLNEYKGIKEVVEFIIQNRKYDELIHINIAGNGSQSDFFSQIKNKNITYLGLVNYNKIDEYLQNGHFTIIPSKFDNLPTVGLESLMNGLPIIGNSIGGIPEIVSDNNNGFLFDGLSDEELSKLFERITSISTVNYNQLKANARASYLKKFSMDTYVKNMSNIINS